MLKLIANFALLLFGLFCLFMLIKLITDKIRSLEEELDRQATIRQLANQDANGLFTAISSPDGSVTVHRYVHGYDGVHYNGFSTIRVFDTPDPEYNKLLADELLDYLNAKY